MLPISPPLPLIQSTFFFERSIGSTSASFELVFPPPKFVILKSDPSRFDRYLNNSAASSLLATFSSQRSSKKRSFSVTLAHSPWRKYSVGPVARSHAIPAARRVFHPFALTPTVEHHYSHASMHRPPFTSSATTHVPAPGARSI